jgi:hypothetical protein
MAMPEAPTQHQETMKPVEVGKLMVESSYQEGKGLVSQLLYFVKSFDADGKTEHRDPLVMLDFKESEANKEKGVEKNEASDFDLRRFIEQLWNFNMEKYHNNVVRSRKKMAEWLMISIASRILLNSELDRLKGAYDKVVPKC